MKDVMTMPEVATLLLAELAAADVRYSLDPAPVSWPTTPWPGPLSDKWLRYPANAALVARRLHKLGCQGSYVPSSCPVAVYLQRHGLQAWVAVSRRVMIGPVGPYVDLPAPVLAFVHAFDTGQHPELLKPASPTRDVSTRTPKKRRHP